MLLVSVSAGRGSSLNIPQITQAILGVLPSHRDLAAAPPTRCPVANPGPCRRDRMIAPARPALNGVLLWAHLAINIVIPSLLFLWGMGQIR